MTMENGSKWGARLAEWSRHSDGLGPFIASIVQLIWFRAIFVIQNERTFWTMVVFQSAILVFALVRTHLRVEAFLRHADTCPDCNPSIGQTTPYRDVAPDRMTPTILRGSVIAPFLATTRKALRIEYDARTEVFAPLSFDEHRIMEAVLCHRARELGGLEFSAEWIMEQDNEAFGSAPAKTAAPDGKDGSK